MKVKVEILRQVALAGRLIGPAGAGAATVVIEADEAIADNWIRNGSARPVGAPAEPGTVTIAEPISRPHVAPTHHPRKHKRGK